MARLTNWLAPAAAKRRGEALRALRRLLPGLTEAEAVRVAEERWT